ncbi:hypothetical protein RJZ56_004265 [Blastomyces dermatitidis]
MLQRLLTHGDSHNNKKELLSLLKDICSDASALCVEDSTRKLAGPPLLNHFNDVTDLDVKLGLNEELNDRNMPQFWSRKQLLPAASVCFERPAGKELCNVLDEADGKKRMHQDPAKSGMLK